LLLTMMAGLPIFHAARIARKNTNKYFLRASGIYGAPSRNLLHAFFTTHPELSSALRAVA